jgi:hypothetical protein
MWAAAIVLDSHPPCLHLAELNSRAKIDLLGEVVPEPSAARRRTRRLEKLGLVRYPHARNVIGDRPTITEPASAIGTGRFRVIDDFGATESSLLNHRSVAPIH